jgi:hypothetical protein
VLFHPDVIRRFLERDLDSVVQYRQRRGVAPPLA